MDKKTDTDGVNQRFGRLRRLRRPSEFRQIFRDGRSVADDVLVIYGLNRSSGPGRLGLAVGRRLGSAPRRNRWKRLIREAYRRHVTQVDGLDIVVIPRPTATPNYGDLTTRLPRLIRRLNKRLGRS
jgi:ribonuclease P protein component